ncbi:MAG: D-alanyl-D-alanine carboxypeptidase family protein [Eubacterium sp.]
MKKIIVFILSLSMLSAMPVRVYAKNDVTKEINAKSSILMCMDTKEIIKESNAYEHLSPASVTKIMSILLIMEAIDSGKISLNDMVTASENAVSMGGSQIWLEVGEQMSVNDLLKAVIIASANDACTLLGEYIAGSDSGFVDMMNKRAKELGLENTHFENCTGLDDSVTNHYSCAYDLAIIACEVMKHDLVKDYSTIWLDSLRNGKTELNNTNKLINKYNGITGLKTGTTSNAGFCLCATATRDGLSLVSVVLGAETSEDRFNLTVNLLDYGFANYQINKIKVDEKKIKSVKIKNGVVKSVKPAFPDGDSVLVKKGTDKFTYDYRVKEKVEAPVKQGDILGEIVVKCGEKELASVPLTAEKDIKKTTFSYIFAVLFSNI